MKKVIVFILVVALALGGIGFAHAAVTAAQDDLILYPTLEIGDMTALEGRIARITFTCGDHLIWKTDYPFGGEAVTEFTYDRAGIPEIPLWSQSELSAYLTTSTYASTNGSFAIRSGGYGDMFREAASKAENNGEFTMEVTLSDYLSYYLPEFQMIYEGETGQCYCAVSLMSILDGVEWYEDVAIYDGFNAAFRFPVQEADRAEIYVHKSGSSVDGFSFNSVSTPELTIHSDVSARGTWMIASFVDENGAPLPYGSPAGHGIYFIPWKVVGQYQYTTTTKDNLAPDFAHAELIFPLADDLLIQQLSIDSERGLARILSAEGDSFVLTVYDLNTRTVTARLEVLPRDAGNPGIVQFAEKNGFLLVTGQGNLALVDAVNYDLLLTAPDVRDLSFSAGQFKSATGDLRYDGQTLILMDTGYYREDTLWAAAWKQGENICYGEYDCSLMRCNDHWYYDYITADRFGLELK